MIISKIHGTTVKTRIRITFNGNDCTSTRILSKLWQEFNKTIELRPHVYVSLYYTTTRNWRFWRLPYSPDRKRPAVIKSEMSSSSSQNPYIGPYQICFNWSSLIITIDTTDSVILYRHMATCFNQLRDHPQAFKIYKISITIASLVIGGQIYEGNSISKLQIVI